VAASFIWPLADMPVALTIRFREWSGRRPQTPLRPLMTQSGHCHVRHVTPLWRAKLSRCVLSLEENVRRREFTMLLGGAAVWPAVALAQQNNKKRLVGLISAFNDKEMMLLVAAFRARMQELGWIEGQNVVFDVSATSGDYAKLDVEAVRLVSASADVIVAQGTPGLVAARKSTRTIPIVFTQVADPVGQRLIDSLAHPGGNATGLTNFEFGFGAKWVELLAEFDPAISQVTLVTNPANENTAQFVKVITAAGATKNFAVRVSSVRDAADIQDAIENSSKKPGGGLIIFPDGLLINHRALIVELAARYRLPAVYPFRVFPEVGGLLSYGPNFKAIFRKTAEYVDKLLRGAKAADLPVEAPTELELVINLKTAQALGLSVSPQLQIAANELIQ
jgi:putative ABC transport system substrate-binding protein